MPFLPRPSTYDPSLGLDAPPPLAQETIAIIKEAARLARKNSNGAITTEHVLIAMLNVGSGPAYDLIESSGIGSGLERKVFVTPQGVLRSPELLPFTPAMSQVFSDAWVEASGNGNQAIDSVSLLMALARKTDGMASELILKACPKR